MEPLMHMPCVVRSWLKSLAVPVVSLVALAALAGPVQAQSATSWSEPSSGGWEGSTRNTPLPEEQAFQAEVIETEQGPLVRMTPAPGYYLYQDRTRFEDAMGKALAGKWPPAETHQDPHFGATPIHRNQVEVQLPPTSGAFIKVSFQGCQAAGICYPPMIRHLALTPSAMGSAAPMVPSVAQATPPSPPVHKSTNALNAGQSASDEQWVKVLQDRSPLWILGAFFVAGLLLSLTPCVLPMVPVVLGLIAPVQDTRQAPKLALLYVLAHSSVLALAGAAGAALGGGAGLVQQLQTAPWLLAGAAVFALLAAWQVGWLGHGWGNALQTRLHIHLTRLPHGRGWAALALGAGSALILGPCVAPPTAGAVLFVAQTGSISLGAGALFALGVGMGTPLLLLAAGGTRWLPRTGAWMTHLTHIAAMGLFGVSAILLDRLTGGQWTVWWISAWALLSIGLWMPQKVQWGLGGLAGTGVAAMLAIALVAPVSIAPPRATGPGLVFETVSATELAQRMQQGKPVLLDLSANWCGSCLAMEKSTFADPQVKDAARNFQALRLNLDDIDEQEKVFLKDHGLIGPPAVLFFNAQGHEVRPARLVGPESAPAFTKRLQEVALMQQTDPAKGLAAQ